LERSLDEFLRTESERWLEETMARLYTPFAPGPFALKHVMQDPTRVAGIAESHMERITAQLLADPDLPPLVLQHEVPVQGHRFRLDVACPKLMLGVEYHSRTYHWGRSKADADNVRDLLIGSLGWKVIYVTHLQLDNPAELIRLFRLTAQAQARQLGVPIG
jgi:very-short-patch-repair endonuclease